ncbi:MAG: hypothetical protein IPK52_27335 [Chloroflexi bacterium]|nr:hypothetical protein [Chloroflexota bacterium]
MAAQDVSGSYNGTGDTIAFTSLDRDGLSMVMLVNADGSNRRVVSDLNGNANAAVWSPESDLLAYQSELDGDLTSIHQLSSGVTRKLTENTVADYAPTWLCGTTDLIWTSEEAGNPRPIPRRRARH